MVDEKIFFREVTLRICGSLEIERHCGTALVYIRDFIPADIMLICAYDPGGGLWKSSPKRMLTVKS